GVACIEREHFAVLGAVVDHDDLETGIVGSERQTIENSRDERQRIAVGNDHGNEWPDLDSRIEADAMEIAAERGLDSRLGGVDRVGLRQRAARVFRRTLEETGAI